MTPAPIAARHSDLEFYVHGSLGRRAAYCLNGGVYLRHGLLKGSGGTGSDTLGMPFSLMQLLTFFGLCARQV